MVVRTIVALSVLGLAYAGVNSESILDYEERIQVFFSDFDGTLETTNSFSRNLRTDCVARCNNHCSAEEGECSMAGSLQHVFDTDPESVRALYGDAHRLDRLQSMLRRVRQKGVAVHLCSTSEVPAESWAAYLYLHSQIMGFGFDKSDILALQNPSDGSPVDKGAVIKKYMEAHGISYMQALFADDSPVNIEKVTGVATTNWIQDRKGMQETDFAYVEVLASLGGGCVLCDEGGSWHIVR
jgi:hypothetical protein